MRTLWHQAARPRLNFTPTSRTPLKSIQGRRTVAANGTRSKVAACDIFAIFLAPLLAAAAFADVSWKETKRKEWDRKFAEINEAIETLRAREVEVWTRIQYRSIRHGAMQQRRLYSTAAVAVAEDSQSFNDWVEQRWEEQSSSTPSVSSDTVEPPSITSIEPPERMGSVEGSFDHATMYRHEKLIALRLALQMILYSYTGSEELYSVSYDSLISRGTLPREIGELVLKLHGVSQELSELHRKRQHHTDPALPRLQASRRMKVTQGRTALVKLGYSYRAGKIDHRELIDQATHWLLQEECPSGAYIYTELLMLFVVCGLDDLARYANNALRTSSHVLNPSDICVMLEHSSQLRNLKALDWVLQQMTRADGAFAYSQRHWQWWKVTGTVIAVPHAFHAGLFRALIRSALSMGQLERAEAYAAVCYFYDVKGSFLGFIHKAFLQYYAMNEDWQRGRLWLQRMIDYLRDESLEAYHNNFPHMASAMGASCLRVAHLLAACGKEDELDIWLKELVKAGLRPPRMVSANNSESPRLKEVVKMWQDLTEASVYRSFEETTLSDFRDYLSTLNFATAEEATAVKTRAMQTLAAAPDQPVAISPAKVEPGSKEHQGDNGKNSPKETANAPSASQQTIIGTPSIRTAEAEDPVTGSSPGPNDAVSAQIREMMDAFAADRLVSQRRHEHQMSILSRQSAKIAKLEAELERMRSESAREDAPDVGHTKDSLSFRAGTSSSTSSTGAPSTSDATSRNASSDADATFSTDFSSIFTALAGFPRSWIHTSLHNGLISMQDMQLWPEQAKQYTAFGTRPPKMTAYANWRHMRPILKALSRGDVHIDSLLAFATAVLGNDLALIERTRAAVAAAGTANSVACTDGDDSGYDSATSTESTTEPSQSRSPETADAQPKSVQSVSSTSLTDDVPKPTGGRIAFDQLPTKAFGTYTAGFGEFIGDETGEDNTARQEQPRVRRDFPSRAGGGYLRLRPE